MAGSLPVPFKQTIPRGPLISGQSICIKGVPSGGADRIVVHLLCGTEKETADIAFSFDARFNFKGYRKVTVCNSRGHGRNHHKEVCTHDFPFTPDKHFKLRIVAGNGVYQVFANDSYYLEFRFRHGLEPPTHIYIDGSLELFHIAYQ